MISFTRKKYMELYLDGQPVKASNRNSNRHTTLVEAAEHASEHAEEINENGQYEIRIGNEVYYTVDIMATVTSNTFSVEVDNAPSARNVNYTLDFVDGYIQAKSSDIDNSVGLKQVYKTTPVLTITGISKTNPAVISYTGTQPSQAGDEGLVGLLIEDVTGMTEVNRLLVRAKNITSTTFEAWTDNEVDDNGDWLGEGNSKGQGEFELDARNFSSYASGGTLTPFTADNFNDFGDLAPNSELKCRCMSSATYQGSTISPRNGNYFLQTKIYYNYDHDDIEVDRNKPRFTSGFPARTEFGWDEERWVGFSVFIPLNAEDDIARSTNVGDNTIFFLGATASSTHMNLGIGNDPNNSDEMWFTLVTYLNDADYDEGSNDTYDPSLAPVVKGAWNDIVIRHRWNPFATETTVNDWEGNPQTFQANRGILQIWTGEAGGVMSLVHDQEDTPTGLRPYPSYPMIQRWQQYKGAWHHNPTTVLEPIFLGFDEYREGSATDDNTGYSDVHPSQASQP